MARPHQLEQQWSGPVRARGRPQPSRWSSAVAPMGSKHAQAPARAGAQRGELAHLDAGAIVERHADEQAGGVGVEPAVADRDVGQGDREAKQLRAHGGELRGGRGALAVERPDAAGTVTAPAGAARGRRGGRWDARVLGRCAFVARRLSRSAAHAPTSRAAA